MGLGLRVCVACAGGTASKTGLGHPLGLPCQVLPRFTQECARVADARLVEQQCC